ncbi:MAG: hypothetical protein LUH40_00735 [Clostridiales bacterium]|nr:hypothetical protein [Clostridiales bacterium]
MKKSLSAEVDSGRLSHAVLLSGGTKKMRQDLAVLLCQALMCESKGEKPCSKCSSCKKIKAEYEEWGKAKEGKEKEKNQQGKKVKGILHPDIIQIHDKNDKNKTIGVDVIRDVIKARADIKPNEAPYTIFLIYEANDMTMQTQNALLKILEDPPKSARFILTASTKTPLLTTVLSRVESFVISDGRGLTAGEKAGQKASDAADMLLNAMLTGNEYNIMLASAKLEKDRKSIREAAEKMSLVFRDAMAVKAKSPIIGAENEKKDKQSAYSDLVNRCSRKMKFTQLIQGESFLNAIMTDCDKNANENLLITRLSIGLEECIMKGRPEK